MKKTSSRISKDATITIAGTKLLINGQQAVAYEDVKAFKKEIYEKLVADKPLHFLPLLPLIANKKQLEGDVMDILIDTFKNSGVVDKATHAALYDVLFEEKAVDDPEAAGEEYAQESVLIVPRKLEEKDITNAFVLIVSSARLELPSIVVDCIRAQK